MPLVPHYIEALRAYEPGLGPEAVLARYGLTRSAKLSSNENPLGVSPRAIAAIEQSLAGLNRYNDGGLELRHALAGRFHVKPGNVICGAGSEGIMAGIVRTFLCDDDEVLTTEAAFQGFQVLAQSRGVAYRTVPYRADWRYDVAALASAITEHTKLIYLANPNNPTGTIFTREEFAAFHARVPERVLVILDEAYFEFAQFDPAYPDSMGYRYDNVITLRTFSKAYGLAAARIGYGFAHEDLIAPMLKIKLPFEPSGIASAGALGALEDHEFLARTLEHNAVEMRFLAGSFRALGYEVIPSHANFFLLVMPTEEAARTLFEDLLRQGVIVRPLRAAGLPRCLRVSIGSHAENEMCVEALSHVPAY
jgi:histidinol-phosphate aminotransferase